MTSTKELLQLAAAARAKGAVVSIYWDAEAKRREGRDIVASVCVANAKGIGPGAMGPISAAERLREFLAR